MLFLASCGRRAREQIECAKTLAASARQQVGKPPPGACFMRLLFDVSAGLTGACGATIFDSSETVACLEVMSVAESCHWGLITFFFPPGSCDVSIPL